MSDRRATTRRFVAPAAFGVVLLGAWALAAAAGGVSEVLLPGPGAVWSRLVDFFATGEIGPYLVTTMAEALGGSALGALVAIPLAVLIHRSRWVGDAVQPFLGATQAIPAIALAPLLVLWIDYGLTAVIVLCALMVFFPILIASVTGLNHVDHDILDAARMDGAGSFDLLWQIEAPLALPAVLAGLKNGFALSVTGAVVGEMVMGGAGLGSYLIVQRQAVDTAGMFATIIVLCAIAASAYSLINLWERRSRIIDSLRRTPG